ncbi:hypothetical protein EW145_g1557 [Phellinidium pouzarii]|uniref:BZIP domain-containing protein n=1 Tax=Phellinidium pouzarii TaxID=167371 RepID=A0A4S4LFW2_9AGAM|nr:hypothetical protein EW145_g1557 [Phellinidium pouzarii]
MSHSQYTLDTASASVLSAWQSPQHQPSFHRAPTSPELLTGFGYRPTKHFPQFPMSPISPISPSSSSVAYSPMSPSPLLSSSLSEFEMLRRGIDINFPSAAAAETRGRRTPCLPSSLNFDFDFDFSLPLSLNQTTRSSLPTPPPTSPETSNSSSVSPSSPTPVVFPGSASSSISVSSAKHSSSSSDCSTPPVTTPTKRQRACISTKDFVPPDVTGLSKREARLVKNRAAAFLSRQRKREEFELMEIRVAELEQENQRLRDLAEGQSPEPRSRSSSSSSDPSELDDLRVQLAATKQREAELSRRLETSLQQNIKMEIYEPMLNDGTSSGARSPHMGPDSSLKNIAAKSKGGASLGLMVLLCTLPSLLSHMPSSQSQSGFPTSQSILDNLQWDASALLPAASDGMSSLGWDLDSTGSGICTSISRNSGMEVDCQSDEETAWKKLEIEGEHELGLGGFGLGALDISFDTRRTKDGKIRVRVHSPASSAALSPSPESRADGNALTLPSPETIELPFSSLSFPHQPDSPAVPACVYGSNPLSFSFADTNPLGQYLGMEHPFDLHNTPMSENINEGTRRRVRIALKSFPHPGREGGEWEVEVR